VRPGCLYRSPLGGSWCKFNKSIEKAGEADVLCGRCAEQREELALAEACAERRLEFLRRQRSLLEIGIEQIFVGLGNQLQKLLPEFLCFRLCSGGDLFLHILAVPAGLEFQKLHPHDVHDAVESQALFQRKLERDDVVAQELAGLRQDFVEVGVFRVQFVHKDDGAILVFLCVPPDDLGAHFHSLDRFQE